MSEQRRQRQFLSQRAGSADARLQENAVRARRSALDVGLWAIVAARDFIVPTAVLVLVGDAGRDAGDDLFPGGALGRLARQVMGLEGLGVDPIDPVRPPAVMLDDLIGDLGHVSLLALMAVQAKGQPSA